MSPMASVEEGVLSLGESGPVIADNEAVSSERT